MSDCLLHVHSRESRIEREGALKSDFSSFSLSLPLSLTSSSHFNSSPPPPACRLTFLASSVNFVIRVVSLEASPPSPFSLSTHKLNSTDERFLSATQWFLWLANFSKKLKATFLHKRSASVSEGSHSLFLMLFIKI